MNGLCTFEYADANNAYCMSRSYVNLLICVPDGFIIMSARVCVSVSTFIDDDEWTRHAWMRG